MAYDENELCVHMRRLIRYCRTRGIAVSGDYGGDLCLSCDECGQHSVMPAIRLDEIDEDFEEVR